MQPHEYIQRQLRRAHVTPDELALKIGFSPFQVADYVNGRIELTDVFIELLHGASRHLEMRIDKDFLYYLCGRIPPGWRGLDEDAFAIAAQDFRDGA